MTSRSELGRWYLERVDGRSDKPLFEPGSWRAEAAGHWLESFLAGEGSLELGWNEGRLVRRDD